MKLLKGRSNYQCHRFEHCGNCYLSGKEKCKDCTYTYARNTALNSPMSTLNIAYFLTSCNYTNFYEESIPRNIIIDEADELDTILTNFISFEFTKNRLDWLGLSSLSMPNHKTVISEVAPWLKSLLQLSMNEHINISGTVKDIMEEIHRGGSLDKHDKDILNRYRVLSQLIKKLEFLTTQEFTKDSWVYYYDDKLNKVTLKPIWLNRDLTNRFLFNYGLRFLFMSATLPPHPVLARTLGLEPRELDYFECDSSFPIESRKIMIAPKYILGRKHEIDEQVIRNSVYDILRAHPRDKGIIHCVSYKLANIIRPVSPRLIIHNGQDKNNCYEDFINSSNKVFVSPSSIRGLDLHDDLARFVVFLKVPFPDLSDIMTSARAYSAYGDIWYSSQTIQAIVQGAGRGMRHEKDYCVTYILDGQIVRLLKSKSSLFPKWFREAIYFKD